MTTRRWCFFLTVAFLLLLFPRYSSAQNPISFFDFLSSYDELEVAIEVDLRSLLKKNDKYLPAHFLISSRGKVLVDTMGEIRSRGNTRKVVCLMPPTKIRFDKSYLKRRNWLDYPTLKVVNACTVGDLAASHVKLENLIYEIYSLFTEKSYRTKAVILSYVDISKKRKSRTFSGFLIEHEDQLASRIKGEMVKMKYFKPDLLDRKNYIIFSMFQYLIGNSDWKVFNKHNLEVFRISQERTNCAVPYDFDYAGLVNTGYAIPHEKLPIKSVTERIYLGPCQSPDEVEQSRKLFISKKKAILDLIKNADFDKKQQKSAQYFISKFYDEIEDKKVAELVFTNCIKY